MTPSFAPQARFLEMNQPIGRLYHFGRSEQAPIGPRRQFAHRFQLIAEPLCDPGDRIRAEEFETHGRNTEAEEVRTGEQRVAHLFCERFAIPRPR